MEVDLSLPADRVVRALDQLSEWRGAPIRIRCDNGPEYVSDTLQQWAKRRGIALEFVQPGKPQQHAYIERYNRTVRYDWLSQSLFDTIEAVQAADTRWLWTHDNDRPNMALGGITPSMKLALAALLHGWRPLRTGGLPSCRSRAMLSSVVGASGC